MIVRGGRRKTDSESELSMLVEIKCVAWYAIITYTALLDTSR